MTDPPPAAGPLLHQLTDEVLSRAGLLQRDTARQRLLALWNACDEPARRALERCLPVLWWGLVDTADPDQALLNFERLAHGVADRCELFQDLEHNPRAVEILLRLFAGSQFLSEILLCNPGYLQRLTHYQQLADLKSVEELCAEAETWCSPARSLTERLNGLRRFQRWELLRIGVCDFFGLFDLRRVTVQLSLLADALVRACLDFVAAEHAAGPAFPHAGPAAGMLNRGIGASAEPSPRPAQFAVIALGKLGGEELNYSSDIDLIFVADNPTPDDLRIAQRLIRGLTEATPDGFLYRVDMRLRPWGRSGELVTSIASYLEYLRQHAQHWEKQALMKARVIAGHLELGRQFLDQIQSLIYVYTPHPETVRQLRDSVHGMKQRIETELHKKGRGWGQVKLGAGSIRDIEFLVQYLQLLHGAQLPNVRSFNTLDALVRLTDHDLLQSNEFRILADGYCFLRTVEHSLQLMHNKQTHVLPSEQRELLYLARRLDYGDTKPFLDQWNRYRHSVRGIYEKYLMASATTPPMSSGSSSPGSSQTSRSSSGDAAATSSPAALPPRTQLHLSRMEQSYADIFTPAEIERHAELAGQLDDAHLVLVDAVPQPDGTWRVTIVGYDYLGELSLISGLLVVYGLSIIDGHVFTYEPLVARAPVSRSRRPVRTPPQASTPQPDVRRKIVDVFTVRPRQTPLAADVWSRYAADLHHLVEQFHEGLSAEAHGTLVKRVAGTLRLHADTITTTLYPVQIDIDNTLSPDYTILHIRSRDTVGFLFELTNALALNGIYIARVSVGLSDDLAPPVADPARDTPAATSETRPPPRDVHDIVYVTDLHGGKITDPAKQRELQAAIVLIKHFTHLLPLSPNPESALLHFREFVAQLFTHPDWPDEIVSLERTEVLDALARLLGVSDFLWSDFLRMQHANLFPLVRDVTQLARRRDLPELAAELDLQLQHSDTATPDPELRKRILNDFKDREMFRVDMRHILGHVREFGEFSAELTDVAEVVVAAALRLAQDHLTATCGHITAPHESPLCVCALGKFGGRELGFASDIELMFVFDGDGVTSGPQRVPAIEYQTRLVESITHCIQAHREGIFEIDLRLRPYGRAGNLAVSLDSFRQYFAPDGPAWPYERQALVKLRPIAGDSRLGDRIVQLRDECVYAPERFDIAAMRGMRERQIRQLVTPGTLNAKLSPGGLVDTEYLVQGLQMQHGWRFPDLRTTNTFAALSLLNEHGLLASAAFAHLAAAYVFQRRLIDALRVVRGNARDLTIPPPHSEEFAFLSRRLGYDTDLSHLQTDIDLHFTQVRELTQTLWP